MSAKVPGKSAGHQDDETDTEFETIEIPAADPTSDHSFSIAGYRILRELHRGGQGVVYEALELSTQRHVAVKLLLGGVHASPTAQKRFDREIRLSAQLVHPNIISIFSSGKTKEGLTYYAMDFVRGNPLNEYIRDERLKLEDSLRLFSSVCEAVQYAHHRGVIHRDLKPSNVLVSTDGNVKVLDFGLAKLMTGSESTALSAADQVMGTLRYMSPEQAAGKIDKIDTRTDIYSLGVMLYEVLTGHFPYPVDGKLAEVITEIIETPPQTLTAKWDSDFGITDRSTKKLRKGQCPIDRDMQTIVMKALAKERDRRYQSSGEFGRDLLRYIRGEAIEARRDHSLYVLRTTARLFVRRHQLLLGLSLASVVTIVGGLTLVYYKDVRDRQLALTQRQARAELMVREAVTMQGESNLDGAERRLTESLLLAPKNFQALGNLAIVKKDAHFAGPHVEGDFDRLEESNALCDQALAIKPDNPGLWNVKCVALYSMGTFEQARQACARAASIDPDYYWAYSNMAKVLALQNRFEEARTFAELAVETAQRRGFGSDSWATGAWRTLGTLQLLIGDAAATRSLEHALECNSSDPWTHAMIARLHLDDTESSDSAKAFRSAIVANQIASTPDARIKQLVSRAALAEGDAGEAADNAEECVRLDPRLPTCHLILATVRAAGSEPRAARSHFETALATLGNMHGGELQVDARRGVLWFHRRSDLHHLCNRAATAVGGTCP